MKLKIYKPAALMLTALLAMSSPIFAQETPVQPPAPVEAPALKAIPAPKEPAVPPMPELAPFVEMPTFDDKALMEKLGDLKINMRHLQRQFNSRKWKKTGKKMELAMKDFKENFKGFDKNLAESLDNLGPQIANGFKDFDKNFDFNFTSPTPPIPPVFEQDNGYNGKLDEETKTYSKTYPADANDKLEIDNRYGKVTVNTWNRNEFKVDVQIKVATSKEGGAKKLLDNVKISDGKNGSTVFFKTILGNENSNSSWSSIITGGRNTRKIEINYNIYMPAKNALSVTNRYGGTYLPDLSGKVTINNTYGSLVAKSLTNPANVINVKYGSANIENLGGDLDVAYGSLTLGEGDKINADVSYGSAKIGRIKTSGNINVKFSGALNIGDLDKNLRNLSVNSSYSAVNVGLNGNENLDFDVTVNYGGFTFDKNIVNVTNKPASDEKGFNPTKNYKGRLGKGNADKVISIKSNFGSVKFE